MVKKVERKQAGLHDPFEEHEKRPLAEHLEDYRVSLGSKGDTEKHVDQTVRRITILFEGCGFRRLHDLNAIRVAAWLAEQRRTRKRFSAQTSNFYQDVAKAFCAWLETHDRIPKNSLTTLTRLNVATDRRHDRRALSEGVGTAHGPTPRPAQQTPQGRGDPAPPDRGRTPAGLA